MIALEIRLNNELIAVCGDAEQSVVSAMVSARKMPAQNTEFTYEVECLGLRPKNADLNEVLRWLNTKVALNDEISFKIVKTDEVWEPFDIQEISAHPPTN